MITAACSSVDSKATQAAEVSAKDSSVQAAPMPMPVATLGSAAVDVTGTETQRAAISQALDNINSLNQKQAYGQSLALTQELLQQYPDNPDLALMEGVLFNQLGRIEDAEQVFLRLSEKHPELPEPLNNLAVIYVNRGDMNRAISTLQKAFETHPSYARIQSNLRTLYTTLASQAYNRALNLGSQAPAPVLTSLDRIPEQNQIIGHAVQAEQQIAESDQAQIIRVSNKPSTSKLSPQELAELQAEVIRAAQGQTDKATEDTQANSASSIAKADTVNTNSTVAAPATNSAPEATEAATESGPAIKAAAATGAPSAQTAVETAAETTKPQTDAPQAIAAAQPSEPAQATVDPEAVLKAKVTDWAAAWSAQNVSDYISFYVDDYRPNRKTSHNSWKKKRKQRLTKPDSINVSVSNISVDLKSDQLAKVKFTQRYKADTYQDKVIKTLTFKQQSGDWKISAESSRKAR